MTCVCLKCDGLGLIRFKVEVPARVYGEPRQVWSTSACPACHGMKVITVSADPKSLAANDR